MPEPVAIIDKSVHGLRRRARAALTSRHIADAVAGSEPASSAWPEATLPPLQLSGRAFTSLLTWFARRSKDLQRLRLSASIMYGEVG